MYGSPLIAARVICAVADGIGPNGLALSSELAASLPQDVAGRVAQCLIVPGDERVAARTRELGLGAISALTPRRVVNPI
jgi:hypothetical protein